MAPTLEHYFTMRAYFDRPNMLPVGKVKGGPQRTVVPLNTGWLRGSGTNAELLPGSGDWFLVRPLIIDCLCTLQNWVLTNASSTLKPTQAISMYASVYAPTKAIAYTSTTTV